MKLTKTEVKLLIDLLELASDEFSNHGCNDFNPVEEGTLTEEEWKEIYPLVMADVGYSIEDYEKSSVENDFLLMDYLRKKLCKQ